MNLSPLQYRVHLLSAAQRAKRDGYANFSQALIAMCEQQAPSVRKPSVATTLWDTFSTIGQTAHNGKGAEQQVEEFERKMG